MRLGNVALACALAVVIGSIGCVVKGDGGDGDDGGSDGGGTNGGGAAAGSGSTSGGGDATTGGAAAGSTGGSTSSGPGDAMECAVCLDESTGLGGACHELDAACADDQACDGWRACIEACLPDFQKKCFDDCDELYALAEASWGPLEDCVCRVCGSPCAPGCP